MPFESVADEMHRFKEGDLHSGKGGPVVKDRKQAIAIALSEERRAGLKRTYAGKGKKRKKKHSAQKKAIRAMLDKEK